MIGGIFLQAFGYGGGFDNLFYQLESLGVFTFILPFLIIFALVFGVMSRIKLFGDGKPIYVIISLAVSLMALQFGFVSQFFADIFPQLGIWLSVILVGLIVVGLLNPTMRWNKGFMVLAGVVVFGIILWKTFGLNWYNTGYWLPQYWPQILIALAVIFAFGAIVSNTPKQKPLNIPETLRNMFSSDVYAHPS